MIKIKVVPATGEARMVEIEPTAVTVGAALRKGGFSSQDMNLSVNGRSADENSLIEDGATITLTERARGS